MTQTWPLFWPTQRLPMDLGPSNCLVLTPPTTEAGCLNGGVVSTIESPGSLRTHVQMIAPTNHPSDRSIRQPRGWRCGPGLGEGFAVDLPLPLRAQAQGRGEKLSQLKPLGSPARCPSYRFLFGVLSLKQLPCSSMGVLFGWFGKKSRGPW